MLAAAAVAVSQSLGPILQHPLAGLGEGVTAATGLELLGQSVLLAQQILAVVAVVVVLVARRKATAQQAALAL